MQDSETQARQNSSKYGVKDNANICDGDVEAASGHTNPVRQIDEIDKI